tara:strand:- start:2267 stop:2890 length:624 start_codon:yes stop_codon:yes gene_type:complete
MTTCTGHKKSWLFNDCGCGCKGKKQEQKFLISIMSALVFFIIANPDTFRITRRLFGKWISSPTGCPTGKGLMFHTLVFLLVTWGMMNIRREGFEMIESEPSPSTMQIIPEDAILVEEKPIKPSPSPSPSVAPSAAPSSMMEIVPPPMVDMPLPLPDMSETQFSPMDSGLSLGAFDITSVPDSALPGEFNNAETVTCQCSNGKSITMN